MLQSQVLVFLRKIFGQLSTIFVATIDRLFACSQFLNISMFALSDFLNFFSRKLSKPVDSLLSVQFVKSENEVLP